MTEQAYWEKMFRETEGRAPENLWQLMQYAAIMQQQSKRHTEFWKGLFGL